MPKTVTTYDDAELGLAPGWAEHLDPNIREELKQGRINRLEAKAALDRAEAAERELNLYRAGIPAGDKRGQVFAETYKGSNDPAEVKAAFEELFGPLDAAGGDAGAGGAGSQGAGDAAAADKRIAAAGAGGGAPQTPGTTDLRDALRNAKTTEEVKEIIRHAPPEAGIKLPDD